MYVFNLAEEPLLRAQLIQLTPTENVLLLTIHHIIFDGWSVNIFLQELTTIYSAYVEHHAPTLPEIHLQYVDFAMWQRQWLQGEVLESQLAYWQQKLALIPALLELPGARPRPAVQSFCGETQLFTLEQDISEALVSLSQQQGVTLFILLLTAFKVLLYRYTNQSDIVIGTPVANRQHSQIQGMIGFFVNNLVLRTDLSGNPTFLQLLKQVRKVVLEAYEHQDLPFEKLVEALHPERDLSYTPLFQIDFALEHEPTTTVTLNDLTINLSEAGANHTAKFDLSLWLQKTEEGLTGAFEYSTDLFEATTIARMIEHWQTLLASIVENPEQRLSDFPILMAIEQHKLLVDRRALPKPEFRPELELTFVAPRTPIEEMLAAIWAEVLRIEQVGINDNFFDLGGHSLQAAKLVSKLSAKMNLKVSVKLLFEHPTLAELAAALNQLPSQIPSFNREESQAKVEKPVTASLTQTTDLSPFLQLEQRSLLSLFAVGKIAPVDAAALGYIPLSLLKGSRLTRHQILQDWFDNLPMWDAVMETKWGRIAGLILPIFEDELYSDPQNLVQMTVAALEMAARLGAKTVSLTGLIPSATDYGCAIVKAVDERTDLPTITTGHATTCSTVVLTIKKILQINNRSLEREEVAFIGLGSVGLNSLRLMLKCLPHPSSIILCDVYSKLESLQNIQRELISDLGFRGSLRIATSSSELPSEIYDASLIIGATNVPDILNIKRVKPGTLIVDDSGPHCFSPEQAIKRFEKQKDILSHIPHFNL